MAVHLTLTVNGEEHTLLADPQCPLLYVLRDQLGLTAAKFGCGLGQCGACKVIVNGAAVCSCQVPIEEVVGAQIETLEGMGSADALHPLQAAFLRENAGQCGYCVAGILVTAKALLERDAAPSRDAICAALDGNICRCGSHPRFVRAIEAAALEMRGPRT